MCNSLKEQRWLPTFLTARPFSAVPLGVVILNLKVTFVATS